MTGARGRIFSVGNVYDLSVIRQNRVAAARLLSGLVSWGPVVPLAMLGRVFTLRLRECRRIQQKSLYCVCEGSAPEGG